MPDEHQDDRDPHPIMNGRENDTSRILQNYTRLRTRQKNVIESIQYRLSGERPSVSNLEVLHSELDRARGQFDEAQRMIEENALNESIDAEQEIYHNVLQTYIATSAKIREWLQEHRNEATSSSSESGSVDPEYFRVRNLIPTKLPPIKLPTFDGNWRQWSQFKDMFISVIDGNKALTDVQKLHYLLGALSGEAKAMTQNVELTSDNYKTTWMEIQQRYENKRLIVNAHLKALMEIAIAKHPMKLQSTLNQVRSELRSLENLLSPDERWNAIIIYILESRIDPESRQSWEMKQKCTSIPSVDKLIRFLEKRVIAVQSCPSLFAPIRRSENVRVHNVVSKGGKCLVCNGEHEIVSCSQFLEMSPKSRVRFAFENRLCYRCLKSGHFNTKCFTKTKCKICSRLHHDLLHKNESAVHVTAEEVDDQDIDALSSGVASLQNSPCRANTESTTSELQSLAVGCDVARPVVLPTAIVYVCNAGGQRIKARAMLDSCSQVNLATENLVRKLKVKPRHSDLIITGVGNKKTTAVSRTAFTVESMFEKYACKPEFQIIAEISSGARMVPETSIQELCNKRKIKLADDYTQPQVSVDLLLGAEYFNELLYPECFSSSDNLPPLRKTKFGWVFIGKPADQPVQVPVISNVVCCFALEAQLEKFWAIEELPDDNPELCDDEKKCEELFVDSTCRNKDGRRDKITV